MNSEKFAEITARCQPHPVFSSDWTHYYSDDFADSLLPEAGIVKGKHLRFYDGAEIVPLNGAFPQRFLYLSPNSTPLALTFFSFPKGVKACEKWPMVQPDDNELCAFFETDINDRLKVCFRAGGVFKKYLHNHALQYGTKDLSAHIDSLVAETNLGAFQVFFKDEISHYKMLSFIGEMINVDMAPQSQIVTRGVYVTALTPFLSEPAGNNKRTNPEKKHVFIRIDFKITDKDFHHGVVRIIMHGEEIFSTTLLPNVFFSGTKKTSEKINSVIHSLKSVELGGGTPENETIPSGDYFLYWDCTEHVDSIKPDDTLLILFDFVTPDGQKATTQYTTPPRKVLIRKLKINNFITILGEDDEEIRIFGDNIIERQKKFISRIPKEVYDGLKEAHKLILHLPEIMVKLDWLHGALCQIHWLEGSRKSLKFPYEFFMSEERVKNVDTLKLKEYFKKKMFLTKNDCIDFFSHNLDLSQLTMGVLQDLLFQWGVLYNEDHPKVRESLNLFRENLALRETDGPVGDSLKLYNEIREYEEVQENPDRKKEYINETFFQSFELGSEIDLDNVGSALGKYSLRCYYTGYLHKNTPSSEWILDIEKVQCRFFDSFNFIDDKTKLNPKTWISQPLGCWKFDTEDVKEPLPMISLPNWYSLSNKDFRELQNILHSKVSNSCNDFYIRSNLKTFSDEYIKKSIQIR